MRDLLIELLTEEIPASYIEPGLGGIADALRKRCAGERLDLPEPALLATPRRMVLHFPDVPERAESVTEMRRGPSVAAAYDEDGNATRAAAGFAKGQGVAVEDLEVMETEKGDYVAARVALTGRDTAEILSEALPRALRQAEFPKSMRWTGSDLPFARPIRNLLVIFGDRPVPVAAAGLVGGCTTRGHRFLSGGEVRIGDASLDGYRDALREAMVLVDPAERRERILDGLRERIGADRADAAHPGLLHEVTYLAEWPTVIEGRIDEEFLELPVEVLEVAMRHHLRFFPVFSEEGRPEARFLSVMDREPGSADVVREGNELVLFSRLADARFFLVEDRKQSLSDRVQELDGKGLHRDLGTYGQKAARLSELSALIAVEIGHPEAAEDAARAGRLAKADLVTEMVGEFPELQGTVGRAYAEHDGEPAGVAEAIEDHYRPRGPSDDLPRGPAAVAVALAEKLDNLAGFIAVAGSPSGSSDPFGLRRQALGLIRIARDRGASFSLGRSLDAAAALLDVDGVEGLRERVAGFVRDRLYQYCLDGGHRYDLVRATLAAGFDDIEEFFRRLAALGEVSGQDGWDRLVAVVERVANIVRGEEPPAEPDPALLSEPAEHELLRAIEDGEDAVADLIERGKFGEASLAFVERFAGPVHEFFEKVYVNVDVPEVRQNRLALLGRLNRLFAGRVADLSDVEHGGGE